MNLSDEISSVSSIKIEKFETFIKNIFNNKNENEYLSNVNPQKTFKHSSVHSGIPFSIPSFNY